MLSVTNTNNIPIPVAQLVPQQDNVTTTMAIIPNTETKFCKISQIAKTICWITTYVSSCGALYPIEWNNSKKRLISLICSVCCLFLSILKPITSHYNSWEILAIIATYGILHAIKMCCMENEINQNSSITTQETNNTINAENIVVINEDIEFVTISLDTDYSDIEGVSQN